MGSESNTSNLIRMIKQRKVDGVILTRLLEKDKLVEIMKESNVPFVAIGSVDDSNLIQIDIDSERACFEFTSGLIAEKCKSFCLISGDESFLVNKQRTLGFYKAIKDNGISDLDISVYSNLLNRESVYNQMNEIINKKFDCIVCGDDVLCGYVLSWLYVNKYQIPTDVKVASFYNSFTLEQHNPPISVIETDISEMGKTTAQVLLSVVNKETVPTKTSVGYKLLFKDSTR